MQDMTPMTTNDYVSADRWGDPRLNCIGTKNRHRQTT